MSPVQRERFGRRCDALVHGGVIALLVFTPLAFGSVHAWAQAIMELLTAALVIVWGSKALVCGSTTAANDRLRSWSFPMLCFGAIAVAQLLPLPPAVLRVLSPSTYALYRDHLPGWPDGEPFSHLDPIVAALRDNAGRTPQVGPLASVSDQPDAAVASAAPMVDELTAVVQRMPSMSRWRPLSIYRYRDVEELLRMLTYSAVFFFSSLIHGNWGSLGNSAGELSSA
jgi:hypothetical protein